MKTSFVVSFSKKKK